MTLQECNTGFSFQRDMSARGYHADFSTVFAQALPNTFTGQFNPLAVEIFSAWAHFHPDLQAALDFLKGILPNPELSKLYGL